MTFIIYKAFHARIYLSREEEEENDENNDMVVASTGSGGGVPSFDAKENDEEQNETRDAAFEMMGKKDEEASSPFDLSSYDRLEIESIEKTFNMELNSIDPNAIEMAVKRAKELANVYFKSGEYEKSAEQYTTAIAGARKDKTLWRNRAAARLQIGERLEAIHDSVKAVELDEKDAKSWYRLGTSLMANHEYLKAAQALNTAAKLMPGSKDIEERLAAAKEMYEEERKRKEKEEKTVRRDLALRLRKARREDRNQETINQWKQTLGGPDWDVEDYAWRPTFLPIARSKKIDYERFMEDPRKRGVVNYAIGLAELSSPKTEICKGLVDFERFRAYEKVIGSWAISGEEETAQEKTTAIVLSSGCGILPALVANSDAIERVIAIERNQFLYRNLKQIGKANKKLFEKVSLVDQKLESCEKVKVDDEKEDEKGNEPEVKEVVKSRDKSIADDMNRNSPVELPRRANKIVTDLFDFTALGLGALSAIDICGHRKLVTPDATVTPSKITIKARLIELRLTTVSGFDLSAMNNYRWSPQCAKVNLYEEPHEVLSKPFECCAVDLNERLQRALRESPEKGSDGTIDYDDVWEFEALENVEIIKDGTWNAVAFWFEGELDEATVFSSLPPKVASTFDDDDDNIENTVNGGGKREGIRRKSYCESFNVGVQYLDDVQVKKGDITQVAIKRDSTQIYFESSPPQMRARHAHIPSWHFDMLNDSGRNDAYEKAIKRAVERKKREKGSCEVLDAGAGSGILSMFAARAGADYVHACEQNGHMCDVGEETVCINGYGLKIMFHNKDVRRLFTKESEGLIKHGLKPDGNCPEMDKKSDVLVFEVFDSGLIGEGAFHIVGMARHRLLKPDATLVPRAAKMFAAPIEYRFQNYQTLDGKHTIDLTNANRWRYRDDYEGVNLEKLPKTAWRALAKPKPFFNFDFYAWEENMQPKEEPMSFEITEEGTFNAIAFWFDLELDEETTLTTNPFAEHGEKGATWQQAVQYVEELTLKPGDSLKVVASHDTYGISFRVDDSKLEFDRGQRRTKCPLYDGTWQAHHIEFKRVTDSLARTITQSPVAFRETCETAVACGSRPGDLKFEAWAGADFCTKFMA